MKTTSKRPFFSPSESAAALAGVFALCAVARLPAADGPPPGFSALFNGRGWDSGTFQTADPTETIDPASIRRWTQTLHVTLRSMKSTSVSTHTCG